MKRKTAVITAKTIKRQWHLVDLKDQVLGRAATAMSQLLTGKLKPDYSPNLDSGDWVVAINAKEVRFTGGKEDKKYYRWHTGYPGGFRERSLGEMMARDPRQVIRKAVSGMLAKNKLRSQRLRRLKVFADANHPYQDKFVTN